MLDCDPGLDDAVAILTASRYADLVAITTVNGNVSLDKTTRNALVVVQVAGAIARTISNWVQVGDRVVAGQRLGVIHFGSRTDVLLPRGTADVLVSKGTRVHAGVTPLARLRVR